MPRWLNEDDVRAVLSPVELIDAIETALSDFSAGRVAQPVRTAIGSLRLCDLARYKEPSLTGNAIAKEIVEAV
jgi:ornithine cyclodeaminase/alanine dehydrogenase-like protein (mu-crystallin family)